MLSQEEFDALPVIDDYTPTPSGGRDIPTMDIKNSYNPSLMQAAQQYGQFGTQDQQAQAERFVINEMRNNGLSEPQAKQKFAMSFADMWGPSLEFAESNYNPNAIGPMTKYGQAKGARQVLDSTGREVARQLGIPSDQYDPFEYNQNKQISNAYLNQMYDKYGSPELAFAAYNAGPGNVDKAIKRAGSNDPRAVLAFLPNETQKYVPKIMGRGPVNSNQPQQEAPSQYAAPQRQGQLSQEEFDALPLIEDEPEVTQPKPEMGWGEYARGIGGQFAQGGMYNFADEAGIVDPEFQKQFEEQYPKAAIGSQIAGGLAPAAASYILTLLTGGAAAPAAAVSTASTAANVGRLATILKAGGRVAAGLGPKEIAKTGLGRIAQGVGYGSAYGALSGAGSAEGDLTDRAVGATMGGATGGIFGGALGSGAELLLKKTPSGRVGKEVNKIVKDVTDSELQAAQSELAQAASKNVPLFLPDALDQADVNATVKALMRTKEARNAARDAIDSRSSGQLERATELLDTLSPQRDSYEAGAKLQKRSKEAVQTLKDEREQIARQTYGPVYKQTPALSEDLLTEILRTKPAQSAYNELRDSRDYIDFPENSTELIHALKSKLLSKADDVTDVQKKRLIGNDAKFVRGKLNENVKGLAEADKVYQQLSSDLTDVLDSGLEKFSNTNEFNVGSFGKMLLDPKTPVKRLEKISESLGEDGTDLIRSAVRAELQDRIEAGVTGRDITAKFNTPAVKKRLSDLMGEDEAVDLLKNLDQEVLMAKQNRALSPRSDTADNLTDSNRGLISALIDAIQHPVSTVVKVANKGLKGRGIGEDAVKTITDPSKSADILSEILAGREKTSTRLNRVSPLTNSISRSKDPLAEILLNYLNDGGDR